SVCHQRRLSPRRASTRDPRRTWHHRYGDDQPEGCRRRIADPYHRCSHAKRDQMSNILSILIVGREPAILEVVERLINSHEGWSATKATTPEEAEKQFRLQRFPIVLVGAGISAAEE